MHSPSAIEHLGRGLSFVLVVAVAAAPLHSQSKPGNAVAMVGAGAAMGAGGYMLGVLVARLSAANDVEKPNVRRWPYVAATFAGAALGATLHALDPDTPSATGDVAMSASVGALGGGFLGMAVGVSIDPDLDHNAAPVSGAVGTGLGLAIGIWTGIAQRAQGLTVGDALLHLQPGSTPRVSLPAPHATRTEFGARTFNVGLVSVAF
jgi:hypothetical protein